LPIEVHLAGIFGHLPSDALPLTDLNAQGPLGVFPPAKVTVLVDVLNTIRARTAAWKTVVLRLPRCG
jgi:hypothetical protein